MKITVVYISHWAFFGTPSEVAIEDTMSFSSIADFHDWLIDWDNRVLREFWNYA